ncbi:uncharacterized protein SAMN06296386_10678 [Lachnospiraceae bacterium]|nr:uncharacterized protein SAMN06296386_10678 [Lachnospiraceae bacterium]
MDSKSEEKIINDAIEYIKDFFINEYSGHDYWHTIRVYRTAVKLAEKENADLFVVKLAALLHDIDDVKISPLTASGKLNAVMFMSEHGIDQETIDTVCEIIDENSFKGLDSVVPVTIEGKCVQDADRLDAIGAIGIARAFTYGGSRRRVLYDPGLKPEMEMNEAEYRRHMSTTVNHFYEKLLKLKDMMNTEAAKKLAEHRDQVMREYLDEFMLEWEGNK